MGCSNAKAAKAQEQKPAANSAAAGANQGKEETITLLKSLFTQIDADADGKLDAKELAKALTADSSLEQMLIKAGYNPKYYVLEQLDGNQDGKVSWDEFQTSLSPEVQLREKNTDDALTMLKSMFAKIDADVDGKLDAAELAKALRSEPSLAKLLEDAGFNSHFYVLEQLDSNQDGKVSWDEFKACLDVASVAAAEGDATAEAHCPQKLAQGGPREEPLQTGPTVEAGAAPYAGCWCATL